MMGPQEEGCQGAPLNPKSDSHNPRPSNARPLLSATLPRPGRGLQTPACLPSSSQADPAGQFPASRPAPPPPPPRGSAPAPSPQGGPSPERRCRRPRGQKGAGAGRPLRLGSQRNSRPRLRRANAATSDSVRPGPGRLRSRRCQFHGRHVESLLPPPRLLLEAPPLRAPDVSASRSTRPGQWEEPGVT